MRTFIAIALFSSVAIAATIKDECKPNCVKDCIEVGSGDVGGTNCVMVFGIGPNGPGWYGSNEEGNDHRGTCQESCLATCNILCMPKREGSDGGVAEDRYTNGVWPSVYEGLGEAESDPKDHHIVYGGSYSPNTYGYSGLYNTGFYGTLGYHLLRSEARS